MGEEFLPISAEEMRARGWDAVDFVYVSGDAYVDHPSFGMAIITRVLESAGYRVGVIAQPDWRDPGSVCEFGEPRLGFLVSAGNMDSMVNRYTVNKLPRSTDAYSPGGRAGMRPNHAAAVYGNLIRRTFKSTPIILGGIEASLRRLAHYDYWSDKLKRSILMDSGANIVSYGMGERSIVQIADALAAGIPVDDITFVDGTVYRTRSVEGLEDAVILPSFEELQADKLEYARSFKTQYDNSDPFTGRRLVEEYPHGVFVVQNPPAKPLDRDELDAVYRLPYARASHPVYDKDGGVPAIKEVRFSLSSSRGCFGECSFCALTFHQGRIVTSRSKESLVREAREMCSQPDFKGYINDVGGPTANFRLPACAKQAKAGACRGKSCLFPQACRRLEADHSDYLDVLRALRELPGVKKVFVRSGVRFDYVLADDAHGEEFVRELAEHHVSGQLRVAPEHVSDAVLKVMGKPEGSAYERFCRMFEKATRAAGKKQYVVPYLMSSHPGSTLKEAVRLAEFCRDLGYMPEQVQDFYPTPSTMSTTMYYTGVDPRTMEPVYTPRSPREKAMQRALIQYRDPKNYDLVLEALKKAGRMDLVGYGPECLIRPRKGAARGQDGPCGHGRKNSGPKRNARKNGPAAANAGRGKGPRRRAGEESGGNGKGPGGGFPRKGNRKARPQGGSGQPKSRKG